MKRRACDAGNGSVLRTPTGGLRVQAGLQVAGKVQLVRPFQAILELVGRLSLVSPSKASQRTLRLRLSAIAKPRGGQPSLRVPWITLTRHRRALGKVRSSLWLCWAQASAPPRWTKWSWIGSNKRWSVNFGHGALVAWPSKRWRQIFALLPPSTGLLAGRQNTESDYRNKKCWLALQARPERSGRRCLDCPITG